MCGSAYGAGGLCRARPAAGRARPNPGSEFASLAQSARMSETDDVRLGPRGRRSLPSPAGGGPRSPEPGKLVREFGPIGEDVEARVRDENGVLELRG